MRGAMIGLVAILIAVGVYLWLQKRK